MPPPPSPHLSCSLFSLIFFLQPILLPIPLLTNSTQHSLYPFTDTFLFFERSRFQPRSRLYPVSTLLQHLLPTVSTLYSSSHTPPLKHPSATSHSKINPYYFLYALSLHQHLLPLVSTLAWFIQLLPNTIRFLLRLRRRWPSGKLAEQMSPHSRVQVPPQKTDNLGYRRVVSYYPHAIQIPNEPVL